MSSKRGVLGCHTDFQLNFEAIYILKWCCPSATISVWPQSIRGVCCQEKTHDPTVQIVEFTLELGPLIW